MKTLLIALAISVLLIGTSYATDRVIEDNDVLQSIQVDVPNVVKINKDLALGVEMEKDLVQTNANEGYSVVFKVTYSGSLINL